MGFRICTNIFYLQSPDLRLARCPRSSLSRRNYKDFPGSAVFRQLHQMTSQTQHPFTLTYFPPPPHALNSLFFYQWNLTCLPLFFYEPPPLLRYHYYPPAQFTTAGQQEAAVGGGVHCVWMVQIGYCARWKVEDKPEPSSGLFRLIGSAGYLIWT